MALTRAGQAGVEDEALLLGLLDTGLCQAEEGEGAQLALAVSLLDLSLELGQFDLHFLVGVALAHPDGSGGCLEIAVGEELLLRDAVGAAIEADPPGVVGLPTLVRLL